MEVRTRESHAIESVEVQSGGSRWELFKVPLFVGTSILLLGLFLFTNNMISLLSKEIATTSRLLASFCAEFSFPATGDLRLQRMFTEVVSSIDFPIVITDRKGLPRAWRHAGIDPTLVPAPSLDSLDMGLPIAPEIRRRVEAVQSRVTRLDLRNTPVPMTHPLTDSLLGYVHYGEPPALEGLRWMPYVSAGGLLLLVGIGLWGFTGLRQAERRSIWVGMARETAHQLGTPLSSLMGWIELMRTRAEPGAASAAGAGSGAAGGSGASDAISIPRAELAETLDEMERDVDRLAKVAQRFSHVGSTPILQPQDITPVVRQAVHYVRRRLPKSDGEVMIQERYDEVPPVNLNRELVEWAVENLLANAVSALDKRPGVVEIVVERRKETESVEVVVSDNGRGMNAAEARRAFEPGYTTKRRGWGLGLALARRVAQDYHGGKLFIRRSAPGEGTTVVISFPT